MAGNLAEAFRDLARSMSDTGQFKRKFSGAEDDDIRDFIQAFNWFCENNHKDDAYKAMAFPTHLTGRALKLYCKLPVDIRLGYEEMLLHMKNYFSPVLLPPMDAFKRLREMKKKKSESVQEYYERMLDSAEGVDITEAGLMGTFISGLPSYIEKYLSLTEPEDLATALRFAKTKELVGPDRNEETEELSAKMDVLL